MTLYREILYDEYTINLKLHWRGLFHVIDDRFEFWLKDGKYHRLDGPSLIYLDDNEILWYVNGDRITSNIMYQEATGLSNEDMAFVILKYGNVR